MKLVAAALLLLLLSPHPALAAESPEAFVARWLDAQNRGDFAAYEALYAGSFMGVRSSGRRSVPMDRAAWMKDRARMFKKPMVVEARGVTSAPAPGGGTYIELEQTWASGEYKDVGKKRLVVVEVDGALRITREELLESRRLLLPGQVMKVFVPAASPEAAEATRAELAALLEGLPGVEAWPVSVTDRPPGVVLLACGGEGFEAMADTARALAPSAVARVAIETAAACPTLRRSDDPEERWEWPQVAEARAGKRTIVALATAYTSTDLGDFGRERRGFHLLALLRDERGAVLSSMKGESASDFATLESLYGDKKRVELVESYVDAPCDGTKATRYKRLRRTTWIDVDPAAEGELRARSRDETLERGRCDDSGYREWIRQMNRGN